MSPESYELSGQKRFKKSLLLSFSLSLGTLINGANFFHVV